MKNSLCVPYKDKKITSFPNRKTFLQNALSFIDYISLVLFTVFIAIVPDEKISRWKLLFAIISISILCIGYILKLLLVGKIKIKASQFTASFVIYCLYVGILYFTSKDRPVALNEFNRVILCLLLYYLVSSVDIGSEKFNKVLTVWLICATLSSIYGIMQYYGGFYITPKVKIDVPKMERIMSTFGNPIFFAVYIVATLPIAISRLLASKGFFFRSIYFIVVCILYYSLYLTATRAAWIANIVSLVLFILLSVRSKKVKIVLLFCLFAISSAFFIKTKNVWFRFQQHPLIWRDTLRMFFSKPLTGVGLGAFHLYIGKYLSPQLKAIFPTEKFIINDAHNEYLQILAETGIIGFVLFMLSVFLIYRLCAKEIVYLIGAGNRRKYLFCISLLCSVTAILLQNIFSVDMRFVISSLCLFFFVGILTNISESTKEMVFNLFLPYRIVLLVAFLIVSFPFFSSLYKPFIANYKLKKERDFFEERLQNPQITINELMKLQQTHPDDYRIYEKLGWIYAKEKMWDKAIESYMKSLSLNPLNYGVLNNLGNIFFLLGNKEQAIEMYRKSLAVNDRQIDARLNLATAYYYKGMLKEASDELKRVLQLDPNNEKAIILYKKMSE
jgi:tetratricopeptide (TPR) repeat protein